MVLYLLVKLLLGYWLIIKKEWIKDQEKLFLFFDLFIVIIYFFIIYLKGFNLVIEFLMFGIILIIIVLMYKAINYMEQNNEKILNKIKKYINIKKQEKVKKFLLNPKVAKSIYYFVWMLPWNIGYWIYFWIQENGWYARVWISSTRDIVLWKLFKWDSRDYFYNLFEKIKENEIYIKIRNIVIRLYSMLYRIIYIFCVIRETILKISIKKYIWIRIIIYMYLSMFYLYILMEIQILNKILFYLIIIIELLALYYTKEIMKNYEKEFLKIKYERNELTSELIWIINFLKIPFNVPYMNKWVKNKFIWDRFLSKSVSLNILYKYILYVNKNTKGYFDRQMNIMTRVYREKYLERKSILWDILPRTRYVIISLKNESFYRDEVENLDPDFTLTKNLSINLINNKNLYLGYYEKTYSKTSLLMLIWVLRVNKHFWTMHDRKFYLNDLYSFYKLDSFCSGDKQISLYIYIIIYIYIYHFDKRLIDKECLFSYFFNKHICFYNEEMYFYKYGLNIYGNKNELKIPEKIYGIKNYKKMFKIMGRIMLYEEDSIIWNENLQQLLDEFNNSKNISKIIKNKYESIFENILNDVNGNSIVLGDGSFDDYKIQIKNFIEINKEEIFDLKDFRYFFVLSILKNENSNEELKIIKTWCDNKDVEEVLDKILYQIIRKNISFSEHEFFNNYKGNNYNFDNISLNPNEVEFEKIKNYKL